jgi:acyl-CoA thioester hydrolase
MRQLGVSYREMEQEGCLIAVVDAHCRYKSPARYDDELIVRTHLKNVRESLVHFSYELLRVGEEAVLAEGDTTHIVIDKEMNVVSLPEKYIAVFRRAMGRS